MIVKLICQDQHKLMLENVLCNHHIKINEAADVILVEKGMDFKDDYHLIIVFSVDYIHTLINLLQGFQCDDLQTNMLLGKQGEAWVPIAIDDVAYFNAQDNDTFVNLSDGRNLKIKYKLYQLEEGLLPNSFIRINKSEIVNIKKIKSISPMFKGNLLIYIDSCKMPLDISRNYVKSFKERLGIT